MTSVSAPSLFPVAPALTDADKSFVEALAGAIGSVVATWAFYPLDTLKTRLQVRILGRQRGVVSSAPPPWYGH